MKREVVYYSRTGNTKKVAEVIAEVLGTKAKSIEEKIDLQNCDLLCIGGGIYYRKIDNKLDNFLKNLGNLKGKKCAVFGTYGGKPDFLDKIEAVLQEKGAEVVGKWGCKGKYWGVFHRGNPNEKDFENARAFAKTLL